MKPPDDPVPSGDRTMARQLTKALRLAGHQVELVSRLKCRLREPGMLKSVAEDALREVDAITARWQRQGTPDLIMTYHVYYKSPDLIGAQLARQFDTPFVTVEASYAGKRDRDEWAPAQALSSAAIRQAQLNICFTDRDAEGVAKLARPEAVAVLPPFADFSRLTAKTEPAKTGATVKLLAIAMMLKGNKLQSFRLLAEGLRMLEAQHWQLTIVGDGAMRQDVEAMFSGLDKVRFVGQVDAAGVAGYLADSDALVWPGYREAFGLAYLEAQGAGLPVIAMRSGGVAAVVLDGQTGTLVEEGNASQFAAAVDDLIENPGLRERMGKRALEFARKERGMEAASARLGELLQKAMST
ncbi:MAG: glycosyltransferase family 4 protein [Pseudomonadota bacterium]